MLCLSLSQSLIRLIPRVRFLSDNVMVSCFFEIRLRGLKGQRTGQERVSRVSKRRLRRGNHGVGGILIGRDNLPYRLFVHPRACEIKCLVGRKTCTRNAELFCLSNIEGLSLASSCWKLSSSPRPLFCSSVKLFTGSPYSCIAIRFYIIILLHLEWLLWILRFSIDLAH